MDTEFLTFDELDQLDMLLRIRGIDLDVQLESPQKPVEAGTGLDAVGGTASLGRWSYKPGYLLILEHQGKCKLSDETRRMEEEWMFAVLRKTRGLRSRKRYTRKRGTVHPKKKEATYRRTRSLNWSRTPLTCVLHRDRRKCKSIDQDLWNKYIKPLWEVYDPQGLSIDFPKGVGTRADPWTVWNMTVRFEGKPVFRGEDQFLFELSDPQNSGAGSVPSPDVQVRG